MSAASVNSPGVAWVALCNGPCAADCSNYVDYLELSEGVLLPVSPPTCATFSPAPFDTALASFTTSPQRTAFAGSGNAGAQADWTIAAFSRD